MNWIFDNERPIYIQLVEEMKAKIISGYYKPGEKLPSVREFAKETQVNPNTIQRSLMELENQGLIYTKRTSGKYVTESVSKVKQDREKLAKQKTRQFLDDMLAMGLDRKEIIQLLEQVEKGGK